jgi:intracellular sulfur oxidation DsrE/DsrF family protein
MSGTSDTGGTSRRRFLGALAAGAGAVGVASLSFPHAASAEALGAVTSSTNPEDPDSWFTGIKGKHRAVFDIFEPHGVFPFLGPMIFLATNASTGTPARDCSVVTIIRHEAVPFALGNSLWEKYKLGDATKVTDPRTKASAVRNIFWQLQPGDFVLPGLGDAHVGIDQLQAQGVMYFACGAALQSMSAAVAQQTNQNPDAVKQEFMAAVLPGVHVVPSGVWALGRAQEHGCAYCFGY